MGFLVTAVATDSTSRILMTAVTIPPPTIINVSTTKMPKNTQVDTPNLAGEEDGDADEGDKDEEEESDDDGEGDDDEAGEDDCLPCWEAGLIAATGTGDGDDCEDEELDEDEPDDDDEDPPEDEEEDGGGSGRPQVGKFRCVMTCRCVVARGNDDGVVHTSSCRPRR